MLLKLERMGRDHQLMKANNGGKWRRSLRNKKVPLRDITGSGIVSKFGEKRKMQEDKQKLDLMEEDFEEGSKHKLVKRDENAAQQGGELEASPAMPPLTQ